MLKTLALWLLLVADIAAGNSIPSGNVEELDIRGVKNCMNLTSCGDMLCNISYITKNKSKP